MESVAKEDRFNVKNPGVVQLYSACTPNGIKAAACLEEIAILRADESFSYEAHSVDIRHGENNAKEFRLLFPNGKIPAILDFHSFDNKDAKVFESGAILLYLAERYDALLPKDPVLRIETMKWLFWGSSSLSVQFKIFGFYYKYCPHGLPYCINRYSKECHRLLGVLENHLQSSPHPWVSGGKCWLCRFL
jgi:GST-like protein